MILKLGAMKDRKRAMNVRLNQCRALPKRTLLLKLLYHFLCTTQMSMTEYFDLGSGTLFHIKCDVSTKQLLFTNSVGRRDWHTGIELTFCVYTLYVGPNGECIILIFILFSCF
jgi:hypothetical protein